MLWSFECQSLKHFQRECFPDDVSSKFQKITDFKKIVKIVTRTKKSPRILMTFLKIFVTFPFLKLFWIVKSWPARTPWGLQSFNTMPAISKWSWKYLFSRPASTDNSTISCKEKIYPLQLSNVNLQHAQEAQDFNYLDLEVWDRNFNRLEVFKEKHCVAHFTSTVKHIFSMLALLWHFNTT